jgi:hypothetical protein
MKFSILRFDEVLPDLRLLPMHNPEKKDNTISAICGSSHLGFFGFDVHGEKALQQRSIFRYDSICLVRKDCELAHRVDGKAPLCYEDHP